MNEAKRQEEKFQAFARKKSGIAGCLRSQMTPKRT